MRKRTGRHWGEVVVTGAGQTKGRAGSNSREARLEFGMGPGAMKEPARIAGSGSSGIHFENWKWTCQNPRCYHPGFLQGWKDESGTVAMEYVVICLALILAFAVGDKVFFMPGDTGYGTLGNAWLARVTEMMRIIAQPFP